MNQKTWIILIVVILLLGSCCLILGLGFGGFLIFSKATPIASTGLPAPPILTPLSNEKTPMVVCTPPACKPGETYICPSGDCPGGCGTTCATPTGSPRPMCTPPACKANESYFCPSGNCPGGCGTTCATHTPGVSTPTVKADVNYKGVSFSFPAGVARDVKSETIPAENGGADSPPWVLSPEYVQFTLNNYPLQNTFHKPQLMVYPVDAYLKINPAVAEEIKKVQELLKSRPAAPANGMPFLPFWNAGSVMTAQVKYLDFQNGSGVRYLTQYAQDVAVINNNSIFYTFQGLSKSGKYYISAILPVSNPALPADSNVIPGGNYNNFVNQYPTYIADTKKLLDSQPASSYKPDLSALDALIQSVQLP